MTYKLNKAGKLKVDTTTKNRNSILRTVNLTNIKFTKKEINLLNHGLPYSVERPLETYCTNLRVETETGHKTSGHKTTKLLPHYGSH
jgi:hypothetical protein